MSQTLPTVVGMGVTARAIDTMFGKGNRTRTYGGKKYKVANWHPTKSQAEKDAQYFRKAGHPARVARVYNRRMKRWGYAVYVR